VQKWMLQHEQNKTEITQSNTQALVNEARSPEESSRVVVKNGSNIRIIPSQDIMYIEAYDDYVKIFTKDTYHLKKKTMSHFEEVLDKADFLRVHRSYILNLQQITKIEASEKGSHIALLKSGVKIPLSRMGYGKLKEVLGV